MKRSRNTAKQVIDKYVSAAIMKIEVCGSNTIEVYEQLRIYRSIANELGWTEIFSKIDRALSGQSKKGIFTEP